MAYDFLVVDDEQLNRSYLRDLISEFEPGAMIREAASARAALLLIEEKCPDVLLLDIRMPEMDGFNLLDKLAHRDFELIFITAYSEYAIRAIKEGAIDYLLKPIKRTDFRDMLTRVRGRRTARLTASPATDSANNYLQQKLIISHNQGKLLVPLADVLYLQAHNTYTTLFLKDGQKITTSKAINKYEERLSRPWFFRIHKSYIINMAHFKEYNSQHSYALMDNGEKLSISRYRLTSFLELVDSSAHGVKL